MKCCGPFVLTNVSDIVSHPLIVTASVATTRARVRTAISVPNNRNKAFVVAAIS